MERATAQDGAGASKNHIGIQTHQRARKSSHRWLSVRLSGNGGRRAGRFPGGGKNPVVENTFSNIIENVFGNCMGRKAAFCVLPGRTAAGKAGFCLVSGLAAFTSGTLT